VRRRRRLSATGHGPGALWAEILDTAADLGLPLAPNLSPRRLVQFWSRDRSGARTMPEVTRSAIMDVAHAEELDRYAGGTSDSTAAATKLPDALRAWERSRGTQARWRAWMIPQSMVNKFAAWRADLRWPSQLRSRAFRVRLAQLRRAGDGEKA
jgi:hypothetical protein